tara:strand:- start:708 stop:857 length:150 start_codon:yes stop_codon:yes gene_type:complete
VKTLPFTIFYIEEDIFVAVPLEDDGEYDKRMVYLLGKRALHQYQIFDIV